MIALSLTAPLARAVARGWKTQTRRLVRWPSAWPADFCRASAAHQLTCGQVLVLNGRALRPAHAVGDHLWIREPAISQGYLSDGRLHIKYVSDAAEAVVDHPERLARVHDGQGLPNGCHREAARTFVGVAAFRVERLTAITGADVLAEGMGQPWNGLGIEAAGGMTPEHEAQLREKFANLWNSIYPVAPWESDPWVTVTTFALENTP
jgi:hypothetical protein